MQGQFETCTSTFFSGTPPASTARSSLEVEPDATSQACSARAYVPRTPAATERHAEDKVDPDRSPMLSLVGMPVAAFVMSCMCCKPPRLAVPLRPAMGKGLLRADATGTHPPKEHGPIKLQPQVGDQHRQHRRARFLLAMVGRSRKSSPPWDKANGRRTRASRVRLWCSPMIAAPVHQLWLLRPWRSCSRLLPQRRRRRWPSAWPSASLYQINMDTTTTWTHLGQEW